MAIDLSRKVAGVPVVYLAAGGAAILGVVAWRMKPANGGDSEAVQGPSDTATEDPYAGFETNGTVVVQPTNPPAPPEPDRPDTNEEWVRVGAEWLVAKKNVSGVAAYTALTKYIDGKSRSITEAQWVEDVLREKGYPPDPFVDAPIPITPTPTTPTTPGTPKPTPKPSPHPTPAPGSKRGYGWYQVRPGDGAKSIAAKYGISVNTFYAYNGVGRIVVGEWVKVRFNSNPISGYRG